MKPLFHPPQSVAVVQPLPGIGDMIWHLPHTRALSRHVGQPVTLIAKPRSAADQIFKGEQAVRDVLWLDRNPEQRQGKHDGPLGVGRLIKELRSRRFDAIVLLHHSHTLAFAALVAGVPVRCGYGYALQRSFLNCPPFLPAAVSRLHPFEQATAWLKAAGIALGEPEPQLIVSPESETKVWRRVSQNMPRHIAIGIGSSEPYKQWGAARFTELTANLLAAGWSRLVLIGGKREAELVRYIMTRAGEGATRILPAIGWDLSELAVLLKHSVFYVGNDTGVTNMAAAMGITSFCLFGGTPPFHHSRHIVPIMPPDGRSDQTNGMASITVSTVLTAISATLGSLEPAPPAPSVLSSVESRYSHATTPAGQGGNNNKLGG
jgi:heptosyltransferase II